MDERKIISFHELSEEWQEEAITNLGDDAYNATYLEPKDTYNPTENVLWDLTEAYRTIGTYSGGFEYNAVITISNNSAMLLNINETGESAEIKFI